MDSMRRTRPPVGIFLLLLGLMLGSLSGCGGSQPTDTLAQVNSTNMKRLANLYFAFQSKNDWRGPKDEAALKTFVKDLNPELLKRVGVEPDKVDGLFLNERDGQPFKIRYGVPGSSMGSPEPVIFEAEGVDGVRLVGRLNMTEEEVDETRYNELWGSKPVRAVSSAREIAGQ